MKNLRIKLLLSLIAFAVILVAVISYVNRQILVADIEKQVAMNKVLIENHILTDMQTIDNAHFYFDKNMSEKMEQELRNLKNYLDHSYIETHLFLPYEAETVRGESSKRVVYVKFVNFTKIEALQKNTQQFWILLTIALLTSFIMLLVINKILSKTIHLATFDPLTGVYNRATYIRKIDNLLRKRKMNVPGLLLIDLDNFKQVNDQYGHVEGDHILIETALILKRVVKNNGFVVRFGGDEFAIVLYDTTEQHMQQIAEGILTQIRTVQYEGRTSEKWSVLSVSMGGSLYLAEDTEMSLFERADKALYQSKNAGKDQYSSYQEVAADNHYKI